MLYIDIETVPAFKSFEDADERTQELFVKKIRVDIETDGGSSAIWLVGRKESWRRWGFILGLAGQP